MIENNRPVAILGLGTAVPPHRIDQADAGQRMAGALGTDTDRGRWAERLFRSCGVQTRFTCEPNLLEPVGECRYLPNFPVDQTPTTAERMKVYKRESVPLGLEAAKKAMEESRLSPADISHLMVVSCTGFFIPGIDLALIQELQLSPHITRIPLTFMGCAAGMTALRIAKEIVEGSPSSHILIVCVELCTLHIQPSSEREDLFATAFFGDGAAACVVGTASDSVQAVFELGKGRPVLFPDCPEDMVWNAGNHGFDLYLSPELPQHLARYAPAEIHDFLAEDGKPEFWAVHPGGRGILDVLQQLLQLSDQQALASRSVLREYGNLSSATILFVIDKMRRQLDADTTSRLDGIGIAFGPGLTAELLQMTYIPNSASLEPGRGEAVV